MQAQNAGREGYHNLDLMNRVEGFRMARAMGITFSAAKLVLLASMHPQWPLTIQVNTGDLHKIGDALRPPSPEINEYLNGQVVISVPEEV